MKVRVGFLLPVGGRTAGEAGVQHRRGRAVVGTREADHFIDHRARIWPEAQRPAHRHAALAVAHDRDLAPGHRVHRADGVHDVLARGLDVVEGAVRWGVGAPRDAELVERRLPVPREVLLGRNARRRTQEHQLDRGVADAAFAGQRGLQVRRRDVERGTGLVERGITARRIAGRRAGGPAPEDEHQRRDQREPDHDLFSLLACLDDLVRV